MIHSSIFHKIRNCGILAALILSLAACQSADDSYDASGTFEAVETIISAEANGKILAFNIEEGQTIEAGQEVGYIDSTQLHLQKLQLEQSQKAILTGRPEVEIQTDAMKKELANAKVDRERIANLVEGGVATQKQLDDVNARIAVLEGQIKALESNLSTTTSSLNEQSNTLQIQLQSVQDQLNKCKVINPINGTVLSKYAQAYELTGTGRPLYKIANLDKLTLRVYATDKQLSEVKVGQEVKVLTDRSTEQGAQYTGTISWISAKAEFTPKTIQTKDERSNAVYAIKVLVPNDGYLRIGMYGEIKF